MKELRISICAYHQNRFQGQRAEPGLDRAKQAMSLARQAKQDGAQLAIFPEIFALVGSDNTMRYAQPLDGPVFEFVAETAAELDLYIAVNHPTDIDSHKYNTTVLFNPKGAIEGFYHKVYPVIWEMENGCSPGEGPVVLDTPIGRIGFATCYDLNFSELRLAYRDLQPDLILFPSVFRGGLQTQWWGYETRSYLVSSIVDPGSRIISPVGRIIKEIDGINSIMTHTFQLDYQVFHYDYNNLLLEILHQRYGNLIEIDSREPEGVFLLTARGDVSIKQIAQDCGLEEIESYFKRARAVQQNTLKGQFPSPGPKAW